MELKQGLNYGENFKAKEKSMHIKFDNLSVILTHIIQNDFNRNFGGYNYTALMTQVRSKG